MIADHFEVLALLVLPLLLPVTNIKSKKTGEHWRPSRVEVQRGFMLHVSVSLKFIKKSVHLLTIISNQNVGSRNYPVSHFGIRALFSDLLFKISSRVGINYKHLFKFG